MEKRIAVVMVRCTEEEKAAWGEAARKAIFGLSEWVRRTLSKAAAGKPAAAAGKPAGRKARHGKA
jgi:hypothetical protein